jgi:integrase
MKALSPAEAKIFLAECEKSKYGLLIEFQLLTGMRPGECLGLRWSDVKFEQGLVTIERSLVWNQWDTTWEFKETKTAKSRRSIPLPAYLIQRLSEYRKTQLKQRMKVGEEWQNLNLVFCSKVGKPVEIRNLRRTFKLILKRAGLEKMRLYDLRHSCATLLLAAGENPKVVSERLGHSSVQITLDRYTHVLPSMQQQATDKLEMILKR